MIYVVALGKHFTRQTEHVLYAHFANFITVIKKRDSKSMTTPVIIPSLPNTYSNSMQQPVTQPKHDPK